MKKREKKLYKGGVSDKAMTERKDQKGESYQGDSDRRMVIKSGTRMFKPRDGKNKIRIVPPLEGADLKDFGMEFHYHFSVGPNEDGITCNERTHAIFMKYFKEAPCEKDCYTCDEQTEELWDNDRDLAISYYPSRKMLMWILDLLADDPDQVLLWMCPWSLYEEVVERSFKGGTTVAADPSDVENGCAITFTKKKKGQEAKKVEYTTVNIEWDSVVALDEDIAESMEFFDDIIIFTDRATHKACFDGDEDAKNVKNGEEEEEEEEEEGGRKTNKQTEFTAVLLQMDRAALKKYKKEMSLEMKILKKDTDQDLRDKIFACSFPEGAAAEEEEEEEEEENSSTATDEEDETDPLADLVILITDMDRAALKEYKKTNKLDMKILKKDSDQDLREKIIACTAEILGVETEEEEEETPPELSAEDILREELSELDRAGLKKYKSANELEIKVLKKDTDEDLLEKIVAAVINPGESSSSEDNKSEAKTDIQKKLQDAVDKRRKEKK